MYRIFGFTWSKTMEGILMKPYNFTMGIVGFIVAGQQPNH